MDCRILRQVMLKADGNLVCDDSNGYFITLGEVSLAPGWSIAHVLAGGVYAHVRRSFSEGRVPWPGICETCDLFSGSGIARDTLGARMRVMVEPTLACKLACPTCKRVQEAGRRSGSWDLSPQLFSTLLASCARQGIAVEEIQYLGWGEPLLHPAFDELTLIARDLAPAAAQEVTTTGNVVFHDGLRAAQLDRLVISCDGTRQGTYGTFRRHGTLETVFRFMREAREKFAHPPFMEWKYIVFDHNDSDAEIEEAQLLAESFGLDSILFILTNSKHSSPRFGVGNFGDFPLRSRIASLSPAAAMLKVEWTGEVLAEESSLGEGALASLYVDKCTITESRLLTLEGWCLSADLSYVDHVALVLGNRVASQVRTMHRRIDVVSARPGAVGPDCGFLIRVPIEDAQLRQTLRFVVTTRAGEQHFEARMRYHQQYGDQLAMAGED